MHQARPPSRCFFESPPERERKQNRSEVKIGCRYNGNEIDQEIKKEWGDFLVEKRGYLNQERGFSSVS